MCCFAWLPALLLLDICWDPSLLAGLLTVALDSMLLLCWLLDHSGWISLDSTSLLAPSGQLLHKNPEKKHQNY